MAIITRQELEDAAADAQTLEDFINGAADLNGNGQLTTRLGRTLQTLAKLVEVTQSTLDPNEVNAQLATKATTTYVDQQIATRAATTHSHALGSITGGGNMSRLGTVAHTITDWNDANENGWYMANPTATANGPNVPNVWFIGYVIVHDSLWSTQYVHAFTADNDDNSYAYRRDKNNGGWTDWVRVYETGGEIKTLIDEQRQGRVAALPDIRMSGVGYRGAGVRMGDGSLRMWGAGSNYQLGQGSWNAVDRQTPVAPAFPFDYAGNIVKFVRAGRASWAVMDNGDVWSWGENAYGWLGHGNTSLQGVPKKIAALASVNVVDVQVGFHAAYQSGSAAFLTDTGALYTCGSNGGGELGLGDTTQRTTPTLLTKNNWSRVYVMGSGYCYMAGIDTNGDLYTWGYGGNGNLGIGSTANQSSPQFINNFGGVDVVFFAGAMDGSATNNYQATSFAIDANGQLYAWGDNGDGLLGLGDNTQRTVPTLVSAMGNNNVFVMCSPWNDTAIVVKSNGEVWASGYNGYGQLGQGNTTNSNVFVLMTGSQRTGRTTVKAILIGNQQYTSVAILYDDGLINVCGYNDNGQLGVGDATQRTTLTPMLYPDKSDKPVDICPVGYSSEAAIGILTESGNYWQTGYNGSYQLGTNPATSSAIPHKIQF